MPTQTHKHHGFEKFLHIIYFIGFFALAVSMWSLWNTVQMIQTKQQNTSPTITSVQYACSDEKTIQATYFNNTVELNLSDGRSLLLMQGISGSGVRYTNSDESITFWSKGNTAFIEEGPTNILTYNNCVQATK